MYESWNYMNTLTLQYDTLRLLHEPDMMHEFLTKAFHDEINTNHFYELLPFPITLNDDPTDSYISDCQNIMLTSPEKGMAFLSLLYNWWCQRFQVHFESICRNLSSHTITFFSQQYGEDVLYMSCLFTGNLHKYMHEKHGSNIRFVPSKSSLGLHGLQNKIHMLENELVQVTSSQSLKRQSINQELQIQYKDLQEQFASLKKETLTYKNQNKSLQKKIIFFHGKEQLFGKRIAIIGVQWPIELINKCKETYLLKELTTYLATEKLNQLTNLSGYDLVVFSSLQAKHSAYYQTKVQNTSFIHSDKTNADRLFEELCMNLGGNQS